MDLKKFAVVFFPCDNSIEVVPSIWLSADQKYCPFPLNPPKAFKKVQSNFESNPDPEWSTWEVEVKRTFDEFDKANKKAQSLLKKANIDTSETEARHLNTSNQQPSISPPIVPSGNLFLGTRSQEHNQQLQTAIPNRENTEVEQLPILIEPPQQDVHHIVNTDNVISFQAADPRVDSLLEEFRAFQEASMKNQLEILEQLKDLKVLFLRNLAANPTESGVQRPRNVNWPLRTIDEFRECERILASAEIFTKEVDLLARVGGNTVSRTVSNILKFMIHHDLALQMRFTKTSGKHVFGGSIAAKLVRESLRSFFKTDESSDQALRLKTTDEQLDTLIGKWLRDSIGRGDDGRKRREAASHSKVDQAPQGSTEVNADANSNTESP